MSQANALALVVIRAHINGIHRYRVTIPPSFPCFRVSISITFAYTTLLAPNIIMAQSTTRSVMVVGKTGAGKSTVSNAIVGENPLFKVSGSVSSCTDKCKHCDVEYTEGDTQYRLRVIDTVGLFDTGPQTNKETIEELKQYLLDNFSKGINLILFVLREGRFTFEERNTFKFLQQNFCEEISAISALVLTNCEMKDEATRSKIIQEFRSNEMTKPTAEFLKAGIYPVGFPSAEDLSKFPPALASYFEVSIHKDRQKTVRPCKTIIRTTAH